MSNTINADNGVVSGIAGVKLSSDSTGVLDIQTNGTTAITISTAQVVSLTNSPTFTGGTANGVLYLNASKVATSGSALVFDGTNLGVGMTPNNILDITQNQNSSATSKILNNSAGAGARVDIIATNGTAQSQLTTFGTGFSTTGIFRANGTLVYATGAGGLTLSTDTAQPIYFATNQSERMRLDASGNLGLGVTPSAWFSNSRVYQFGSGGALEGRTNESQYFALTANQYIDSAGNFKYIGSTFASRYQQYNGVHSWSTAPSGTAGNTISFTQAMTLDASGNLGLGVTPNAWTGFTVFQLSRGSVGATTAEIDVSQNAYYDGNWKYIANGFATNHYQANGEYFWRAAASGTAGNTISFAEEMRLDTSGNLLVGTTLNQGSGRISIVPTSGGDTCINTQKAGSSYYVGLWYTNTTTLAGYISVSGSATSYVTSSDRRMKENIAPANDSGSVIDTIEVVKHDWKSDKTSVRYGMVAQDLHKVAPEAVVVGDDGEEIDRAWGVDYSKLVPMLVKEVQSLRKRVAELESK